MRYVKESYCWQSNVLPEEVIIDFALGELFSEQGEVEKAIKSYEIVLNGTS